jgi:hypothetical protein
MFCLRLAWLVEAYPMQVCKLTSLTSAEYLFKDTFCFLMCFLYQSMNQIHLLITKIQATL